MGEGTGYVTIDRRDHVLVVTLDAPAKHNAYDGLGLHEVGAAFEELDADPRLRAGVLTGAGGTFCAGADVAAAAGGGFDDGPYPEVAEGLAGKPVVAAIEGHCLGGGLMIANGAHLRVAGQSATFGLPEARWNLPAHWLGTLARSMAPAHVYELALLADDALPASRLEEMGWLNRVVPDGSALEVALEWAERLAALAPAAVRATIDIVRSAPSESPVDSLLRGLEHAAAMAAMDDTAEAAAAFAEKRSPVFHDR